MQSLDHDTYTIQDLQDAEQHRSSVLHPTPVKAALPDLETNSLLTCLVLEVPDTKIVAYFMHEKGPRAPLQVHEDPGNIQERCTSKTTPKHHVSVFHCVSSIISRCFMSGTSHCALNEVVVPECASSTSNVQYAVLRCFVLLGMR